MASTADKETYIEKTYAQQMEDAARILAEAGIEDAQTDLFYLLQEITGFSKAEYLLKRDLLIPKEESVRFQKLVGRRALREPVQYIIGSTEFMGLSFSVTQDVLIPRQDTELLAESAIEVIRKKQAARAEDAKTAEIAHVKVLDLCTGSGALAVAVKHFCPKADVTASDLSENALKIAGENALRNQTELRLMQSDLFDNLKDERFDVILSNPPYVTEEEYAALMDEVRCFEPRMALIAGKEGLDFYRIIAQQAGKHLRRKGTLLLEIGCFQAGQVSGLLRDSGFQNIQVLKDLPGLDRVVTAEID